MTIYSPNTFIWDKDLLGLGLVHGLWLNFYKINNNYCIHNLMFQEDVLVYTGTNALLIYDSKNNLFIFYKKKNFLKIIFVYFKKFKYKQRSEVSKIKFFF